MTIKASGRSALILSVGVFVLLASPVGAATDGEDSTTDTKSGSTPTPAIHKTYRHASHRRKSFTHQTYHSIAKADPDKKAVTADAAPVDNKTVPEIPRSIANANAQMLLAGAQINAAAAIPSGSDISSTAPDNPVNAGADNKTFLVAADQLNDVDRTLQEGNAPATVSAAPAPATTTMTGENSVWDQTTLIGKIFIGFGALLAMASAARMFIT